MIVHEYGHSLQDQAAHFFGEKLEGASMGEGFGDYMAAVMSFQTTGGIAVRPLHVRVGRDLLRPRATARGAPTRR